MQWYIVVGRICGDDEDSLNVLRAENCDNAIAQFKDWLQPDDVCDCEAEEGAEHDPDCQLHQRGEKGDDDPDENVYINYVVACGQDEPQVEMKNV